MRFSSLIFLLFACTEMDYSGFVANTKNRGSQAVPLAYNPNLYEINGQSNVSAVSEDDLPIAYQGDQTGLHIFSTLTSQWETLNAHVNDACLEDFVPTDPNRCGPDMWFLNMLQDYYEADQYLIKYGRDGTALAQSGNVDWSSTAVGEVYTRSNTNHNLAMSGLVNTRPPKAYIWIQGEADCSLDAWANAYATNLRAFIVAKRAFYSAPNMKFIVVRLGDLQYGLDPTRMATVRAAQTTVGAETNNYLVSADGLVTRDGFHYSGPEVEILAQRIFDVIITIP